MKKNSINIDTRRTARTDIDDYVRIRVSHLGFRVRKSDLSGSGERQASASRWQNRWFKLDRTGIQQLDLLPSSKQDPVSFRS